MVNLLPLVAAFGLGDHVILFVDDDAPFGGDGLSWEHPLSSLQNAMDLVTFLPGSSYEFRLAGGRYTPLDDAGFVFSDLPDVTIRGGYAGVDGGDVQDPDLYPTVLDGDRLGNDDSGSYDDNARFILDFTAIARAVTIEDLGIHNAGGVDGQLSVALFGDGMDALTLRNVTFDGCGENKGAVLRARRTLLTMESCRFIDCRQEFILECLAVDSVALVGTEFRG
ncbi:MAG: hypothetical protein KDA28_16880, partial [Phycisphaerales bacterium]|nr:hypothetical protein [Phycisphaerales bacterium]